MTLKVRIDRNAGLGLVPDTIDLAELVDPFHVWETADAALTNNAGTKEEFTTWMDADAAEALGLLLIKKAADLRSLTVKRAPVRSLAVVR
jgi:hypothetical protein